MAEIKSFQEDLNRVIEGAGKHTIAIMCAEREPLDCHRTLLVARRLAERGVTVRHILANSSIEDHAQTESRMLKATGLDRPDLFSLQGDDLLAQAYRRQSQGVAYAESDRPRAIGRA